MRATTSATLLMAALVLAPATGAAQQARVDARWEAWVGCWEPAGGPGPSAVCVLPAGAAAVELVTVADGRVASRETIAATGEARPSTRESCAGTDRAAWSPDGRRVYLRSAHGCDGVRFDATGIMGITPSGEWLDVRGVSMAGGPPDVRVRRYRALADTRALPADLATEVHDAVAARPTVRAAARASAAAPITTTTVAEAARAVDGTVVEAWLVERGEGFDVDAGRLVALADAGVPSRVIDVVVALSYPERFVIDLASREAEPRAPDTTRALALEEHGIRSPLDAERARECEEYRLRTAFCERYFRESGYGYSPYGFSPYGYSRHGYSPYGWGNDAWGYGYGTARPPVIVVRGPEAERGRVVKGKGYSRGGSSTEGSATPRSTERSPSADRGTTRSSGTRSSSGTSSGKSSSPGSTESGRKAKPRNP